MWATLFSLGCIPVPSLPPGMPWDVSPVSFQLEHGPLAPYLRQPFDVVPYLEHQQRVSYTGVRPFSLYLLPF